MNDKAKRGRKPKPRTPRERVLAAHPKALVMPGYSIFSLKWVVWPEPSIGPLPIGQGASRQSAWADAARRLAREEG